MVASEEDRLGEVDQGASNTVRAAFDEGTPHTSCEGLVRGLFEPLLEDVLEAHSTDVTDVQNSL